MSLIKSKLQNIIKEFKPTSWVIDNKTATYVITIIVSLIGLHTFLTLPKEQFPDILVPRISVTTIYAGNSPKDIENLVTRPIEKKLKGLSGVHIDKVSSFSYQDYSLITVEFGTDVNVALAKQKVKDAVDKAKSDLPNDLTAQPEVAEFSVSDLPFLYVNLSGDYSPQQLKKYADDIKDQLEAISAINKVDMIGAPEREIQVNVDPYKMKASYITFDNIADAINYENRDIGGGLLKMGQMNRTVNIKGQFNTANDMSAIVIKNIYGGDIFLQDIATIIDTTKEPDSYADLNGKPVITLSLLKRAGENLIETTDKVKETLATMYINKSLPSNLHIVYSGDQSIQTNASFTDLINTIVIGFILVMCVLMFFMGVTNAFFVALSVPLSVFVAFLFLPVGNIMVGNTITLNSIVLFALLFGLGIIVDDAIVVIENTHRIFSNGKVPITNAAKAAAGEIFVPVLAGTLTTLAPFFPLLMWQGLIGKFMIYLPVMLILTLTASLVVAFLINPVFAVSFMQKEGPEYEDAPHLIFKKTWFRCCLIFGVLLNIVGFHGTGNLILLLPILAVLERYVLRRVIHLFQEKLLPNFTNYYERLLHWVLQKKRPAIAFSSLFALFFVALGLLIARHNPISFFPDGDPNFIYVYLKLPVGTQASVTNSVLLQVESKVDSILYKNGRNDVVESVIANVAIGANNPYDHNQAIQSNLGRLQVSFVPFEKRHGLSTQAYLDEIRAFLKNNDFVGATISVDKEPNGPPTDPPINIEIAGNDFQEDIFVATQLYTYINQKQFSGIDKLLLDVDASNPELNILIDRQKLNKAGIHSAQIGATIRTAIFGKEASKLKDKEDEYKIQVRLDSLHRQRIIDVVDMPITFRDPGDFSIKQVPMSGFCTLEFTNATNCINRKNFKRTIQIQSGVSNPSLTASLNAKIAKSIEEFKITHAVPNSITITQTGETKQQAETNNFLMNAMIISLLLIFLILVVQFNSLSKPFIVLTEIFFSIIGVLLGYALTGMTMPTIMVGVGIIGLAGIVIKNGILIIEFTDELRSRGYKIREATIQAGKIRIIPVLLTALATTLGLVPLAIGLNINFVSLFQHLNPHIYFGGDSVVFWGPLSWTLIFGLIFAFFLTLVMVPSMYLLAFRLKRPMEQFYGTKYVALFGFLGPLFFLFPWIMFMVRKIQGRKIWMGHSKK
ncbi:MAG: efflux RND transporter permease subunit [Phycisphaerales bacterium]|nr:efflux RND transporter permease subunit [Phycisphaerales bacterium]